MVQLLALSIDVSCLFAGPGAGVCKWHSHLPGQLQHELGDTRPAVLCRHSKRGKPWLPFCIALFMHFTSANLQI